MTKIHCDDQDRRLHGCMDSISDANKKRTQRLSSWWQISVERQKYLNECLQRFQLAPEPTWEDLISPQMFNDLLASDWTVCGVALLQSPGRQCTDKLTFTSDTLRALHESWGSPVLDDKCKLHLFDIVDFVALEPVQAQTVSAAQRNIGRGLTVRSDVMEMDVDFVQGLLSCDAKRFCSVSGISRAVGRLDSVVGSWIERYQIPTASMQQLGQLLQWGVRCISAVTKLMSKSGLSSMMFQPRESLDSIASGFVRRLHQSMFGGGLCCRSAVSPE